MRDTSTGHRATSSCGLWKGTAELAAGAPSGVLTNQLVKNRRRTRPDSQLAIFRTAAEEFALHGYDAARVDRIAAKARVNKAMIYYHFGSKAGLYGEILRDMFAAVGARVRAIAASDAAPDDRIRAFVEAIGVEADARPHFPPIWFREIADGGAHLGDEALQEVVGIVRTLTGFIHAGVQAGTYTPIDPLLVHGGIVGPLLLFFASGRLRARMASAGVNAAGRYGRDEVVGHVQRVTLAVLRGIAVPGGQDSADRRAATALAAAAPGAAGRRARRAP